MRTIYASFPVLCLGCDDSCLWKVGPQMDNDELIRALADGVMDGGRIDVSDDAIAVIPDDDSGQLQALALQLWLYDAGQDMREVQLLLEDRAGVLVPLAQLRDWRSRGKWSEVGVLVHQALVPATVSNARASLVLGASRAASYLLRVVSGVESGDALRMKAAMTMLDRGGFPILMRGEMITGSHIGKEVGEFAGMSDDELEAEYSAYSADTAGTVVPADTLQDRRIDKMNEMEARRTLAAAYSPVTAAR